MKKFLFTVLMLLIACTSNAQITFQKTFGGTGYDEGRSVQQTADGGYIIAGSTESFGAGQIDVYLVKTDINGNIQWTKTFGGAVRDYGYSVCQTTDGGYIISGETNSFGTTSFSDIYLIRTDANGDSIWTRTYGEAFQTDAGYSVIQTIDGNFLITGTFGDDDIYLIKTDTTGNIIWKKSYGWLSNDFSSSVQQTIDSGYVIAGSTYNTGAGYFNICLLKTNVNGDTLWIKRFGSTLDDGGVAAVQTADGGYVVTGYVSVFGAGFTDVYLVKFNSSGNLIWSRTFGEAYADEGYSIQQTSDGGYIILGKINAGVGTGLNDVLLIKTDTYGDTLWVKTFGGSNNDVGYSVKQTSDGGYIITGYTWSFPSNNSEIYLIKTDSLGNSGCNEGNTPPIVTSPATIEYNLPTTVDTPATVITAPATIVGSGGMANTLCSTSLTPDLTPKDRGIAIAPNPSEGDFIISFEEVVMKGHVEILNILGESVYRENIFNESKKEVKLENVSYGIYFIKVFDGEKNYCKKLIVE